VGEGIGGTFSSVIFLSRGSEGDSETGSSALRKGVVEKVATSWGCRGRCLVSVVLDIPIIRCRSIFSLWSSKICDAVVKTLEKSVPVTVATPSKIKFPLEMVKNKVQKLLTDNGR